MASTGNRAASSEMRSCRRIGGIGVTINLPPEKVPSAEKILSICFLFAQNYHIAMKYVAPIRHRTGVRTVFVFWDRCPIRPGQI